MVRRFAFVLATLSVLLSTTRPASAADVKKQQLAQALFEEGRKLMDQGRFGEACPKLAESHRLDPGGGTILNLALCHEREGKLATAKAEYEEALRLAVQARRSDREALARERIAALDPRLPRLTITVTPEAASTPGLEVKLDGTVLPREAWGVAMPVDPGTRNVEATADGHAPWTSSVSIDAEQNETIEVPALSSRYQWVGGLAVRNEEPRAPTEARPKPEAVASAHVGVRTRANPAFVSAGWLTVLGGGTAGVTGLFALVYRASAKSGCMPERGYCADQQSKDAADRATTMAWISTISLGAAAVGVVGMLVLPRRISDGSVRASASLAPGGGTLGLSGSF